MSDILIPAQTSKDYGMPSLLLAHTGIDARYQMLAGCQSLCIVYLKVCQFKEIVWENL